MSVLDSEWDDIPYELEVHQSVVTAFQEVTAFQAHQIHKLQETLRNKDKNFTAYVDRTSREHAETVEILKQKEFRLNTRLDDQKREHKAAIQILTAEVERLRKAGERENVTDPSELVSELQRALSEANDARHALLIQIETKDRELEELQASSKKAIEELSDRLLAAKDVHRKVATHLQRALGLWDEDISKSSRAIRLAINLLPKVS